MATGATAEGTERYRERLSDRTAPEHFRIAEDLRVSSIGLGTYLGHWDEATDKSYIDSVIRAVELGCNVIDTAANYRFQRSERNIGDALDKLFKSGKASRDEIVVCTKGGYIPYENQPPNGPVEARRYIEETFINTGIAKKEEIQNGSHCMAPGYLEHQLNQSLRNMKLDSVDVYYIHNPEGQLGTVTRDEFDKRIRAAFEFLEKAVTDGKIGFYGVATWNGFRQPEGSRDLLSLGKMESIAQEIGGDEHHFRFIQLPHNLAMPEALTEPNQKLGKEMLSTLDAALNLGVSVICSASLFQAQLAKELPRFVADALKGTETDAQRALQFVRSTPGVTTALVGMSQIKHVEENMRLAKIPPAPTEDFLKLFTSEEH
ncbi:MAG TPA: aldo/keto reductase [Blastocatellia bacterium]|nr:aldo/keto reductase [Blastocatellia bacterium]